VEKKRLISRFLLSCLFGDDPNTVDHGRKEKKKAQQDVNQKVLANAFF
jgi:hypothetical protein